MSDSVIELRCVAEVGGRTATGLLPVRQADWDNADETRRDELRALARREFQRAARVQLGVELTDEQISDVRVRPSTEPPYPIPVIPGVEAARLDRPPYDEDLARIVAEAQGLIPAAADGRTHYLAQSGPRCGAQQGTRCSQNWHLIDCEACRA